MKLDYYTEDLDKLKISEIKKIAEYFYRQYILKITESNSKGEYFCPLLEIWLPENKMQVSHFIDRNNIELAFDLNNTWLISEKSNVWDAKIPMEGYKSKHHYEYEMWLRKKIGNKKVNKMLSIKRNFSIFVRDIYKKVINEYRT